MSVRFNHIIYMMSDFKDPSAARRVAGLKEIGARVIVSGFDRNLYEETPGVNEDIIVLGKAEDGRYGQRIFSLVFSLLRLLSFPPLSRSDVIWARNTDMLMLGGFLKAVNLGRPKLVWELLDISRAQTSRRPFGSVVRAIDRLLARYAALIVVSSPAFLENYVSLVANINTPCFVWENKLPSTYNPGPRPRFEARHVNLVLAGKFRDLKSLNILGQLTELDAKLSVELWGFAAPSVEAEFEELLGRYPQLCYRGLFRSPADLHKVYGAARFSWGIDLSATGFNSDWLLPNRLYEASVFGVPTIALTGTYLAETVRERSLGFVVESLEPTELLSILTSAIPSAISAALESSNTLLFEGDEPLRVADMLMSGAPHG